MKSNFKSWLVLMAWLNLTTSCAYFFYDEDEDDSAPPPQQATVQRLESRPVTPMTTAPAKVSTVASGEKAPITIVESQKNLKDHATSHSTAHVQKAHEEVNQKLEELSITMKAKNSPSQLAPVSYSTTSMAKGVAAETAVGWLKNGNIRFLKSRFRKDGQSLADVKRIARDQTPHTIVLACSDSQVPPEIIFDQKLGELFVIRNVAQALDQSAVASVEYAVSQLGTKHILVLAHSHCGTVKSACETINGGDAGSENMNTLMKDMRPRLTEFKGKDFSAGYKNEALANAQGVVDDLAKRSGLLALLIKEKKIQINTAIYDSETGGVDFQ